VADPSGSRLSGTVEQVVYLGTLTQFHVATSLGSRLIVHELSGERSSELREGDRVTLAWERDDSSVLHHVDEVLAYAEEEEPAPAPAPDA
jgi:hypothetical protein